MRNYAKIGGKDGKPGFRTQSSFMSKVFAVVANIPKGKTMTYKEVAQKIGNPGSYRAVGNALNKNCDPKIPCHRVIRSNGAVGGFNRGTEMKRELLLNESENHKSL